MSSDITTNVDFPVPGTVPSEARQRWQFGAVAALVVIADWLFYDRPLGISLALFMAAIIAGFVAANPHHLQRLALPRASAVFLLAIFPLIVELSFPALVFAVLGTAYFVIAATQPGAQLKVRTGEILTLLFHCTWRVAPDVFGLARSWAATERATSGFGSVIIWLVPIILSAVFLALFASANPLIEHLFIRIDFRALLTHISISRIGFWLLALAFVWPFIVFVRRGSLAKAAQLAAQTVATELKPVSLPDTLFGQAAILRSLVAFNILFAVQSVLDGLYLWGGVALPTGMSYASYAHRGAYPLIVTALLAAAFVIAAMRPGGATERSPLIRTLVFTWTAQNVLLVGSSLFRLDLYVNSYSLTYWRLAAAIWMLLVAIGLILIVARIVLGRSNKWLVNMNLVSLGLTLYICCFLNFPVIIADYNIAHSRDMAGQGPPLDWLYLRELGPQIIPVVDSYMRRRWADFASGNAKLTGELWSTAKTWRQSEADKHLFRMQDWRAWTYRDHQLASYLRSNPRGSVGQ